jgi:hypothetical protein
MPEATLILTGAECRYLALELSADEIWPAVPGLSDQYDRAGGPKLRIRFLAPAQGDPTAEYRFVFTESELWLLDTFLLPRARTGKLPDGMPVEALINKVWTGLLLIPEGLLFGAALKGQDLNAKHENADTVTNENFA